MAHKSDTKWAPCHYISMCCIDPDSLYGIYFVAKYEFIILANSHHNLQDFVLWASDCSPQFIWPHMKSFRFDKRLKNM